MLRYCFFPLFISYLGLFQTSTLKITRCEKKESESIPKVGLLQFRSFFLSTEFGITSESFEF